MWLFMQKDKNKETIDSSHLACQYYIMQCKKLCPTDGCAKHLSKCQNKCSKNCDHKKTCSEKVQKLKKKFWIRQGLNLQLSWLTTICIRGRMHHSCSPLLSTPVPSMHCQKQVLISNQHIWVSRWRAFNIAQDPFWCVLRMPSNSAIKKAVRQAIQVLKPYNCDKNITGRLRQGVKNNHSHFRAHFLAKLGVYIQGI